MLASSNSGNIKSSYYGCLYSNSDNTKSSLFTIQFEIQGKSNCILNENENELTTEEIKKAMPKFCGSCRDHGLLALRRLAVQQSRKRRKDGDGGKESEDTQQDPERQKATEVTQASQWEHVFERMCSLRMGSLRMRQPVQGQPAHGWNWKQTASARAACTWELMPVHTNIRRIARGERMRKTHVWKHPSAQESWRFQYIYIYI